MKETLLQFITSNPGRNKTQVFQATHLIPIRANEVLKELVKSGEIRIEEGKYYPTIEKHAETIRCVECGEIQQAEVLHTVPFFTYVHTCSKCGYIIMESEWKRVTDKKWGIV